MEHTISRFRSESRFTNPIDPQPRSIPAARWFRAASNVIRADHSQGASGDQTSSDNAQSMRGLSSVRAGNRFKHGFRANGPERAEGGANG